jgi:uncharacterized iron-regulated protein
MLSWSIRVEESRERRRVEEGGFKEIVEKWYGRKNPWPLVEPDLILVFEDYSSARL